MISLDTTCVTNVLECSTSWWLHIMRALLELNKPCATIPVDKMPVVWIHIVMSVVGIDYPSRRLSSGRGQNLSRLRDTSYLYGKYLLNILCTVHTYLLT